MFISKIKTLKQLTTGILVFLMLLQPVLSTADAGGKAEINGETLSAKGAIAIDCETGMEIFAHNADEYRPPASMTKVMSVYLVYEAIANGQIGFDTIVPISADAVELAHNPTQTNVSLSSSGTYTVDELLDVVIVMSACGATLALAELVGGSNQGFINMMNAKVEQWGIDATFSNVYGGTFETQLTPRAMAEIVRRSILDFPEVLEKTSLPEAQFKGRTYPSTNDLIGIYEGIDGYKTGTNATAGACFTGTAQRDDIRIITVVMGSSSNGTRFSDTEKLLDYGFEVMGEIKAEQARIEEEMRLEEEARLAEEARIAEEERLAEEARIAEEMRITEEERIAEEERLARQLAESMIADEQPDIIENEDYALFVPITVTIICICLLTFCAIAMRKRSKKTKR